MRLALIRRSLVSLLTLFIGIVECDQQAPGQCESWKPVGLGLNGLVDDLIVFNGELVAGGNFTHAGVQIVNGIARWSEASDWLPMGLGFNGSVNDLIIFNNQLVAAGDFTLSGTQSVNCIARWDGAVWQPMGAGMNGSVWCLAVYNNELIAGGAFSSADGHAANNVARWDGSAWQAMDVGFGLGGSADFVHAMEPYGADLVAGGRISGNGRTYRWTGSQWLIMGNPVGWVHALTLLNGVLYKGGTGVRVVYWDGVSWNSTDPITNIGGGDVYSLLPRLGELYASGDFTIASSQPVAGIARWNGVQWNPIGTGLSNGAVLAMAEYGGELFAGGGFTHAGTIQTSYLARWTCVPMGACCLNGGCSIVPAALCQSAGGTFSGVGSACELINCGPSAPYYNVYFSEYVEGTGNNRGLEIYNGTNGNIDLAANSFQVRIFINGSPTPTTTIALTGVIAPGDVFVLAHSSAAFAASADQVSTGVTFTGDDTVELVAGASIVLDVVGQVGFDPGSDWSGGGVSTMNQTLRRKSAICHGDAIPADAFDPSVEWLPFPIDTFGGFGSHSSSCPVPCPADIAPVGNRNYAVDVNDLLLVITTWGPCAGCPPTHCSGDNAPAITGVPLGDCQVNVSDLLAVISSWGACP